MLASEFKQKPPVRSISVMANPVNGGQIASKLDNLPPPLRPADNNFQENMKTSAAKPQENQSAMPPETPIKLSVTPFQNVTSKYLNHYSQTLHPPTSSDGKSNSEYSSAQIQSS